VTEIASRHVWRRSNDGGAIRRPSSGALSFLFDNPGVPLRFTPGSNSAAPFGRSEPWILKEHKDLSAEGAMEYSPERNATELRDVSAEGAKESSPERNAVELRVSIPPRSNPFQEVTEMASRHVWQRSNDGGAICRPLSGALSFLFDKTGVPLRFTPGFNPAHPSGALFESRQR
jgi:hypothetical protein